MNSDQSYMLGPTGFQRNALIVGVVCLAICIIELVFHPAQFFRSYLFGEVFWLGIGLSCMGILMLHHLVSGWWGFSIRRPLEAAAKTLAWMAIFFIPILVGMHYLYIWSRPGAAAADSVIQQKAFYLNTPFFLGRQAIYWAIWITLAVLLNRLSTKQDDTADPDLQRRMRNISGPGIALFGFTVTFAGFDWVMSLEPHFFSTIYGMMFVITEAVGGMAFITLVAYFLSKDKMMSEIIRPARFHDFGNLLLVFTLLWAYLSFDQFLIIWAGNVQNEIPWYVTRIGKEWAGIALALVIFHFAVPFLLLLNRFVTFQKQYLAGVAGLLFIMSIVDLFWLMIPAFSPGGPQFHWSDWLALIGLGGIFLTIFVAQLRKKPLVPLHDPTFAVGALQNE
ncbi:MAG TPA: hypothetical protein VFZ08_01015 [Terriglobia bacterium]|nr:hypothetical protein [Terriglobia bacterium]